MAAAVPETVAQPPGAAFPEDQYWPMLRRICVEYGVLLITDEVITGFGRTRKLLAVKHWNILPNRMTVAKDILSSYLPPPPP